MTLTQAAVTSSSIEPDSEEPREYFVSVRDDFARWERLAREYDSEAIARSERAQLAATRRRANQSAYRQAQYEERLRASKLTREERITEWRAGRNTLVPRDVPAMLRISSDGEEVETSLGASFPVEHALRVVALVERIVTRGETFQTNGQQIHLGYYHIDSIDADGTIRAGCHVVARDEVVRLIAELKQKQTV